VLLLALAALMALPAAAQVRAWPDERPPRPLPARAVNFPDYHVRTLKNGLQVIAVSHHEQPAVSLRLIVRAGGAQDPAARPGVASFVAGLLDQGTTTRNAEQIATTIDSIGGAIGAGAGSDLTFITAVVMKDSFNLALDLVSDLARNPAFAADEIERRRQQTRSGLQVSYDDPDYLANVVFDRLVFGFHPYGKPDSGTPESIAGIQRGDLVAFHKTWFGANNAILAVVGDVTTEEAFAGAERAFGAWGPSEQIGEAPVDPPAPTRRVVIVDRPDAVQTEIRVGNIALPRRHPDYLALNLAMRILGGEGGNRLHRVLRSERGLTYGASAAMNAMKDTGTIVADTDTRSETTAETLRLLVDEMWRLQRQRVSPRELSEAQAYLTGSFPLTIETPSAIALQVINNVFYGLDLADLENFRDRVNAVTVDDIQRVAQRYLHPDRLSIVLVGNAAVFAGQLASLGFDQVERIPAGELDLASPSLRRSAGAAPRFEPPPVSGRMGLSPVAVRRIGWAQGDVQDLVARAIHAKGGLERLRGIRTLKAVADVIVDDGGKRATAPTTTHVRYPDGFRVDLLTSGGRVVQVFNDGEYWIRDARGVRQAPAGAAADIRAVIQRDTVLLLLGLADGKVRATRAPDIVEGGRTLPALALAAGGMRPVTIVLDPATALIVGQRYAHVEGVAETEETFSDFRDVSGVKVAFKAVVRRPGAPVIERVVKSFQYNVPLDPTLFTRPI
jgi:zinc protease